LALALALEWNASSHHTVRPHLRRPAQAEPDYGLCGQYAGIREIADEIWLVSFMDYDLGFFDQDVNKVEPVGENPFAPKLLPMSSE
jgi:putative transposase